MRVDIHSACALTSQGYLVLETGQTSGKRQNYEWTADRISAEVLDVLSYPVNCHTLVLESEIALPLSIAECENVEAIVERDYNHGLSKLYRLCNEPGRV